MLEKPLIGYISLQKMKLMSRTKIQKAMFITLNVNLRTNYSILLSKLSMAILLSITTAMFWGRNIGMGEDLSDIIRTLFQNNPE